MDLSSLGKVNQILEALDGEGRKQLLALAQRRTLVAGQVLFREGDHGDEFFVLAKGRVRVTVDDLGQEKELGVLEHGAFFGEMALTGAHTRSATVTALEEGQMVAFQGPAVQTLLRAYPKALEVLSRVGLMRAEAALEKLSE